MTAMSVVTRNDCFSRHPAIAWRRIADEIVLVPVGAPAAPGDAIFVLNEVAARAWELADAPRSIEALAAAIAEEFEVGIEEARADLRELFDDLERAGAVSRVAT
jgi:hypothetical protein